MGRGAARPRGLGANLAFGVLKGAARGKGDGKRDAAPLDADPVALFQQPRAVLGAGSALRSVKAMARAFDRLEPASGPGFFKWRELSSGAPALPGSEEALAGLSG